MTTFWPSMASVSVGGIFHLGGTTDKKIITVDFDDNRVCCDSCHVGCDAESSATTEDMNKVAENSLVTSNLILRESLLLWVSWIGSPSFRKWISTGESPSTTEQVSITRMPSRRLGGGLKGLMTGATRIRMNSSALAELEPLGPVTTQR
ncbi:hypothetical protein DERF_001955 [Dermatophagoides farinae]|uniref:Uncharacterized protein n=1 Tax=Dermatophagoides farinae TaxID=6954 RepID=A0A922IFT9_DERFA|nr:hypothetical protein DERF_001955 [Dermatophagoides farinae]